MIALSVVIEERPDGSLKIVNPVEDVQPTLLENRIGMALANAFGQTIAFHTQGIRVSITSSGKGSEDFVEEYRAVLGKGKESQS